jgi:hypothetical protein
VHPAETIDPAQMREAALVVDIALGIVSKTLGALGVWVVPSRPSAGNGHASRFDRRSFQHSCNRPRGCAGPLAAAPAIAVS